MSHDRNVLVLYELRAGGTTHSSRCASAAAQGIAAVFARM